MKDLNRRRFVALGAGIPVGRVAFFGDPSISQEPISGFARVRDFGAVGDGRTDDTDAIQDAIDAVAEVGGELLLQAGTYGVTRDIDLKMGVTIRGSSNRSCAIQWISSDPPEQAVVVSNLAGEAGNGFAHCSRLVDLRIRANGAPRAVTLRGWNEDCELERVRITEFTQEGLRLEGVSQPANFVTQHTSFRAVRVDTALGPAAKAIVLRDVRRCLFLNLTVDQPAEASGPIATGIELEEGCNQNTFVCMNLEDCTIPIDHGTLGVCYGNTFIGPLFASSHFVPGELSIGPFQGRHGFVNRRAGGAKSYTLLSARDFHGRDFLVTDEVWERAIPGRGDQDGPASGSVAVLPWLLVSGRSGNRLSWISPDEHHYGAAVSEPVSVAPGEVRPRVESASVLVTSNSSPTPILGLSGGQPGQGITVLAGDDVTTIIAGEELRLLRGQNFSMREGDTLMLIRHGGRWYETARSVNRS